MGQCVAPCNPSNFEIVLGPDFISNGPSTLENSTYYHQAKAANFQDHEDYDSRANEDQDPLRRFEENERVRMGVLEAPVDIFERRECDPEAVQQLDPAIAAAPEQVSSAHESLTEAEKSILEAHNGGIVTLANLRRQRRLLRLTQQDIDKVEQEAHEILTMCKNGHFDEALQAIRIRPYLVNLRPEVREYATIHQAVWWGNIDIVTELVSLRADARVLTKAGETALQVAQERGHEALFEILTKCSREAARRPHLRRQGLVTGELRSFNASFARAVCTAPLIGDRHKNEELNRETMMRIADGLQAESLSLGCSTMAESSIRGIDIDLCEMIRSAPEGEMAKTLVFIYTLESFVYREVNKAARLRQEDRRNLAPYMRSLHDALLAGDGFERFAGTSYRVLNMSEDLARGYQPSTVDQRANLLSWDGFTSAATTPQTAYSNFQVFGANVLAIIEQGCGDYPVLVSKMSEFPNEDEVIYPLGQQFKKIDYNVRNAGELWTELGVLEGSDDQGDVIVIHLKAEDAFYDFAQDLFRDGGSVTEALPILEARLQWEKDRKSPWEARAHKELAGALVHAADYEKAMDHYTISLNMFTTRGDPRDIATLRTCIAHVLELQLKYEEAIETHNEVLKVHGARGDDDSQRAIGRIYLGMGMIYTKRAGPGDWDKALELFTKAEIICREYVGDISIEVATAINCTGEVYHRQKKIDKAMEKFFKTLELRELILGDSHPDTALVLMNLGACYRDTGKNELSIETFERAKEVYLRAFGPDTITVANVYMQVLPIHNDAGQHVEMKAKAETCYRIYMRFLGPEHPRDRKSVV